MSFIAAATRIRAGILDIRRNVRIPAVLGPVGTAYIHPVPGRRYPQGHVVLAAEANGVVAGGDAAWRRLATRTPMRSIVLGGIGSIYLIGLAVFLDLPDVHHRQFGPGPEGRGFRNRGEGLDGTVYRFGLASVLQDRIGFEVIRLPLVEPRQGPAPAIAGAGRRQGVRQGAGGRSPLETDFRDGPSGRHSGDRAGEGCTARGQRRGVAGRDRRGASGPGTSFLPGNLYLVEIESTAIAPDSDVSVIAIDY